MTTYTCQRTLALGKVCGKPFASQVEADGKEFDFVVWSKQDGKFKIVRQNLALCVGCELDIAYQYRQTAGERK